MYEFPVYEPPHGRDKYYLAKYRPHYQSLVVSKRDRGVVKFGRMLLLKHHPRLRGETIASLYCDIAEAYFALDDYTAALLTARHALRHAKEEDHVPLQSRALVCISESHGELAWAHHISWTQEGTQRYKAHAERERALSFSTLQQALRLVHHPRMDRVTKAGVYVTAAWHCELREGIDRAQLYYLAAMQTLDDLTHPNYCMIALHYLECLLKNKPITKEHLASAKRVMGCVQTDPTTSMGVRHQLIQAQIYLELGQWAQAYSMALTAKTHARALPSMTDEKTTLDELLATIRPHLSHVPTHAVPLQKSSLDLQPTSL